MITFQYFDGCPNAEATLRNLLSVKEELAIPESEINLVEVPDPALAEAFSFQGSPTILVDGRDIATGEIPSGFSYNCRVYSFEERASGVIPRAFIRDKLIEYGHEIPSSPKDAFREDIPTGTPPDPGRRLPGE